MLVRFISRTIPETRKAQRKRSLPLKSIASFGSLEVSSRVDELAEPNVRAGLMNESKKGSTFQEEEVEQPETDLFNFSRSHSSFC